MSDASKQWATLDPVEKQKFQDEALVQKQRYLEYKRALRERQVGQQEAAAQLGEPVDDEELHQQRSKWLELEEEYIFSDCPRASM